MPAGRLLEVAPNKQQRVHSRDKKASREGRVYLGGLIILDGDVSS